MPETEPTLALSVPQPWAFAILSGGKDIENRNWETPFRGRIWIHAPKSEWIDDIKYCLALVAVQKRISLDAAKARYTEQRKFSAILGSVELYRIDRLDELDTAATCEATEAAAFLARIAPSSAIDPLRWMLLVFTCQPALFSIPTHLSPAGPIHFPTFLRSCRPLVLQFKLATIRLSVSSPTIRTSAPEASAMRAAPLSSSHS